MSDRTIMAYKIPGATVHEGTANGATLRLPGTSANQGHFSEFYQLRNEMIWDGMPRATQCQHSSTMPEMEIASESSMWDFFKDFGDAATDAAEAGWEAVEDAGSAYVDFQLAPYNYLYSGVRDLGKNLNIIDRHIMQHSVVGRGISNFLKVWHREVYGSFEENITDACIVNNDSVLKCVSTSLKETGFTLLSAFDPMTALQSYVEARAEEAVRQGVLSKEDGENAKQYMKVILTFVSAGKMARQGLKYRESFKDLNNARRTIKNLVDKRTKQFKAFVKESEKTLDELYGNAAGLLKSYEEHEKENKKKQSGQN